MKLFLASFAIVTACSFAIAASGLFPIANDPQDRGYEQGINTPNNSIPFANNSIESTSYNICDSYCKLANDQLLAIRAGANYSVTYVSVDTPTTLTPIIGITH